MTWTEGVPCEQAPSCGSVHLADTGNREEFLSEARRDGLLAVELAAPGPALRGRIALLIEGAIEEALERRGAAPPGVGASSDLDATLSDQLYRARLVGAKGFVIALSSLEGIANLAGSLDAEDSAVLRWWLASARERPLRLVLDEKDRNLGVYAAPTSLHVLLTQHAGVFGPPGDAADSLHAAPELLASVEAMEASSAPPAADALAELVAWVAEPEAPASEPPGSLEAPSVIPPPACASEEAADQTGAGAALAAISAGRAGCPGQLEAVMEPAPEIGRASCRERV